MAGWFAAKSDSYDKPGPKGLYSRYGYAGYATPRTTSAVRRP